MSLDTTQITFSFKSEDGSINQEALNDILGIKRINYSTTGTIGSWNISSDTNFIIEKVKDGKNRKEIFK